MVKFNRRQIITWGTAATVIALVNNWLSKGISSQTLPQLSVNSSPVYQSSNGLLELELEAKESLVNIGQKAYLLTYNGQIPAPRLEAKPGDKIRLHFTNNLVQPTNIHYHGLHIPLTGNADNVFLKIEPGEKITYEFTLSPQHPSGTFWYHPHFHGFVAEQLFGGLAGLFVVRGGLDEIPEIKAAQEEFLVLQDFSLDETGRLLSARHMSLMMGREGDIIVANGHINPNFSLTINGLLRLRILNASTSRFYRLKLENHSFYLIARDGHTLEQTVKVEELLLVPGQRADVLIKGDQELGQYRLLNLPYNRGSMGMMGGAIRHGKDNNSNQPITVATINYQPSAVSQSLPIRLSDIYSTPAKLPEKLIEPQKIRRFELNHGMNPTIGMAFLINGEPYDRKRIDTQVKLNTIEDWELINTGVMDHPFHIHGSAFQIISRNGKPEPYLAWRDTVLVPRGEQVRIRLWFRDFSGKTVYHCHILDHEDLGMMGNLMIEA